MTRPSADPPERSAEGVPLWASPWGFVTGLVWLALGAATVGAVVAAVAVIAEADRSRDSRTLAIIGLALALPGLGALAPLFFEAGRRMMRPRRAYIELLDDRLVVHDRWMLRRPLEIYRSELEEIRALPRLPYREYTGLAGSAGRELGALGPLLDWGTKPNCALALRKPRVFSEAIRTLPSKTSLHPISRNSFGMVLLVRLATPDYSHRQLAAWMQRARSTTAPKRDAGGGCLRSLETATVFISGLLGFLLFCAGLAIDAPK